MRKQLKSKTVACDCFSYRLEMRIEAMPPPLHRVRLKLHIPSIRLFVYIAVKANLAKCLPFRGDTSSASTCASAGAAGPPASATIGPSPPPAPLVSTAAGPLSPYPLQPHTLLCYTRTSRRITLTLSRTLSEDYIYIYICMLIMYTSIYMYMYYSCIHMRMLYITHVRYPCVCLYMLVCTYCI